jgi:hypothetical protein
MTIEEETDKLTIELCSLYLNHMQATYNRYPDGPFSTNVIYKATVNSISNIVVNIVNGFEREYRVQSCSDLLSRIINNTYNIMEQLDDTTCSDTQDSP